MSESAVESIYKFRDNQHKLPCLCHRYVSSCPCSRERYRYPDMDAHANGRDILIDAHPHRLGKGIAPNSPAIVLKRMSCHLVAQCHTLPYFDYFFWIIENCNK